MFTVKCFNKWGTIYKCQVEVGVHAIALAHLLAEIYGDDCRSIVYKPGESTHFYNVFGNMDITKRCFT